MVPASHPLRPLKDSRFTAFWLGSLLSNMGTWMQSVAEPWLLLNIGGSSFLLGLDAFAINAPFWLLALAGGVLADRRSKSLIIFFFQGIQMFCPVAAIVLVALGWVKPWMIIGLSLIVGVTDALSMPAFSSLIPSIVRKEDLSSALALNSIQFNLSRVMGPAIAGLLMARLGFLWCFGANAASYAPFFLSIYWLRLPIASDPKPAPDDSGAVPALRNLGNIIGSPKSGWALLSIFCTAFLCTPMITFAPVIVKNVIRADVGEFGSLLTAFGAGGILGPLVILLMPQRFDRMKVSLASAGLYGLVLIFLSDAATLWRLAFLMVCGGMVLTLGNTSANTFLQSQASDANRGQTASLYMLAMRGGLSLGNLVMGAVVELSNVRTAFLVNGILAAALQVFIFRRLYRREAQPFQG